VISNEDIQTVLVRASHFVLRREISQMHYCNVARELTKNIQICRSDHIMMQRGDWVSSSCRACLFVVEYAMLIVFYSEELSVVLKQCIHFDY
jgi:hypothetical protein